MSNYLATDTDLIAVANAIRAKDGSSASLEFPNGFVSAIQNIPSGGGGSVQKKDVNFIDYDGTLLHSYTKAEINAMASENDLPANPSHEGLTAQGWNWTLAQIKTQLLAMPDTPVTVGQMYITQSGATEIDVVMQEGRLEPILTVCVKGTITVDWGDNTTPDTVTGTSLTTRKAVPHTYAQAGAYTISVNATEGNQYSFYGSSSNVLLRKNATDNENKTYSNTVQNIRIGKNTVISNYAFYNCYSLASITIPDSVTSIGDYTFYNCYSLASITIPDSVTSIGNSAFSNCYSLASITIPDSVTIIGNSAFKACYGVSEYHFLSTTVPTGGTTMFNNIVSDCIIYVPYSEDHSILEAYKSAANWSLYSSYIQEEPAA